MAEKKVMAVGIKQLWYADPIATVASSETGLSAAEVKTAKASAKEVLNVHQDTWNYEEAEATITRYKNQLTDNTYRETKQAGDVVVNFTIGEYDFTTKQDLQGGNATDTKWGRTASDEMIYKCIIAKTLDDVYVVFPKASISGRGANTDGAVGLAVSATAIEPGVDGLEIEAWFNGSEIDAAE